MEGKKIELEENKRESVETWLTQNYILINAEAWDRHLKFPKGTIQKFVKYDRKLSMKRILVLEKFLVKINYDLISQNNSDRKNL